MLPALLLAFQLPFVLPDALEEWKTEIEARTFNRIEILRLPADPIPDADKDVLLSYFSRPDFAETFSRAQALTFRYERAGRSRSLILLNQERMRQMQNSPEALIAHELGHLWLAAIGFPAPVYGNGPRSCLAIHIGDIVQHILIRSESDRRGIAWRESYVRDYTAANESLRGLQAQDAGDDCWRAQRLSLMIDVRTGFEAHSFPARQEYLEALARQDPEAEAIAIELIEKLDGRVALEPEEYRWSIEQARAAVQTLLHL